MREEIYISDHSEPPLSPAGREDVEVIDLVTPPKKATVSIPPKLSQPQSSSPPVLCQGSSNTGHLFIAHSREEGPVASDYEEEAGEGANEELFVSSTHSATTSDSSEVFDQYQCPPKNVDLNSGLDPSQKDMSTLQTPSRESTQLARFEGKEGSGRRPEPTYTIGDPISSDPFAISDNDDFQQLSRIMEARQKLNPGLVSDSKVPATRDNSSMSNDDRPSKRAKKTQKPVPATRSKSVKLYRDRKETVRDMTVELWSDEDQWGAKLIPRINELGASVIKPEKPALEGVSLVIGLTRVLDDRWDPYERMFIPCAPRESREPLHIVILDIDKFDTICSQSIEEKRTFFSRIGAIVKTPCIFVVPSLVRLIRKRINEHGRAVQRHARSYMEGSQDVSPLAKPADHEYYSEQQVSLQVRLGVRIVYPTSDNNCLDWLVAMIQDASIARYKQLQDEGPSVRSGKTKKEITIQALIKIQKVTPRVAVNISQHFGSIGRLAYALKQEGTSALTTPKLVGQTLAVQIRDTLCSTNSEQIV